MTPPTTYRIADKAPVFPCWVWDSRKWCYTYKVFPTDTHWCVGTIHERPTHDPTAPNSPPTWAVDAAKEVLLGVKGLLVRCSTDHIDGPSECTVLGNFVEPFSKVIAKHAPATPAIAAAQGGDIPRTPTDSEMLDWVLKHGRCQKYERYSDSMHQHIYLDLKDRAAIAAAMMKKVQS